METPCKLLMLGSTGSIGAQALEVVRYHAPRFCVVGLSAQSRLAVLLEQVREFRPRAAVLCDQGQASAVTQAQRELRAEGITTELLCGEAGLGELARELEYHTLLAAVTGAAGLPSVLEAARRGKRIALANKEALVVAGPILTQTARQSGSELLPVDSEHSAVWQCLRGEDPAHVARVVLTASGGPFRRTPLADLQRVTVAEALKHPTWKMGRKITVDSATLVNKALELIEARWLFDLQPHQLGAVIHPQSIVHSMVEFIDRSVIAQLGVPDMRIPIQLALSYPQRLPGPARQTMAADMHGLEFEEVDPQRFPAMSLGFEVAAKGGNAGAAFNAANEVAVQHFLDGRIAYLDIYRTIATVMQRVQAITTPSLEDVLATDTWARAVATEIVAGR